MEKLIDALKLPSPIQSFTFVDFPDKEIFIKRDDLIHPLVSGNKWRKLKYNIQHALDHNCDGIISFGGAFSNHLYALAAACQIAGLKCKAFVKGDGFDNLNPTLRFLNEQHADITYLDRGAYRNKTDKTFLRDLQQQFPNFHIVPEGGSNELAIRGVEEMIQEVYQQIDCNKLLVLCGVGSGSTITGVVKGLRAQDEAIGMLAVNDASLETKIKANLTGTEHTKLKLDYNTHLGAFGKTNESLITFINEFFLSTGIPIEPLYTGKVMMRLQALLKAGELNSDFNILVIHTGGLQGNRGYNYRFPGQLNSGLL